MEKKVYVRRFSTKTSEERSLFQRIVSWAFLLILPFMYMGVFLLPYWFIHIQDEIALMHTRTTSLEQQPQHASVESQPNFDIESFTSYQKTGPTREGIYALQTSAESGFPPAQYALATLYVEGTVLARDYKEALRLAEEAAKSDIKPAFILAGDLRYAEHDYRAAWLWYKKGYELGNTEALYKLATMEELGQYVPKCVECAVAKRKEAKELGSSTHSSLIEGAPLSLVEAKEKLASNGDVAAMLFLASMFFIGDGVQVDTQKAIQWYERAAEKKSVKACESLAAIYENGLGGLSQNANRAIDWYVQAGKYGSKNAWKMAGVLLEKEGKKEEAANCFEKAGIVRDTNREKERDRDKEKVNKSERRSERAERSKNREERQYRSENKRERKSRRRE